MTPDEAFREFVGVIKTLRTPGTGCPWDLEQNHRSLRPYLIEEAYEVLDAIDDGDDHSLREELGDLLLQVVLHSQVAADRGAFTISDVVGDISAKMIRRHPHVFGSTKVDGSAAVVRNWDAIKAAEKPSGSSSDLPKGLPALMRAQRLGDKAVKAGRHVEVIAGTIEQAREAFAGLEAETTAAKLGDLLFTLCQLARRIGVNAEDCLRESTRNSIIDP